MAAAHRRINHMDRIKINGVWLSEEKELEQISQQEVENLEHPFSEDEIHSALMEMNGDKAPGPDGFTMAFWQSCWVFVKEEVLDLFKEFHEQSAFIKSLNNTFLVLANRLKKVIGKVVSLDQNAFVMGRQILDASLIANEFFYESHEKNGVRIKVVGLDVELHIHSQVFRRAVEGGFLSGCRIRGGGRQPVHISHLLFADDTIVFCEARKEHLTHLSWILFWFEVASGLRINLDKSEIIPVGEVEEMEEMATELGCRVDSMPSVYLGLALGGS
ncbi:hypothetical protein CK203_076109 [Vitis vinifera]|uniref:Uncharacterized protein n=1 Tax=Vitis vinifera TaxID=29760 RepID=A0A438EMC0_VITVI|nr:hypothetical protein CK203_076109 [Vitis vinifera]